MLAERDIEISFLQETRHGDAEHADSYYDDSLVSGTPRSIHSQNSELFRSSPSQTPRDEAASQSASGIKGKEKIPENVKHIHSESAKVEWFLNELEDVLGDADQLTPPANASGTRGTFSEWVDDKRETKSDSSGVDGDDIECAVSAEEMTEETNFIESSKHPVQAGTDSGSDERNAHEDQTERTAALIEELERDLASNASR